MATLKFYGKAFGSSDVTMAVSVDGAEVYNSTVATQAGTFPLHATCIELGEATVADSVLGTSKSVTVTVSGGDAFFQGFGDAAVGQFGSDPGQLKSNVSLNGDTAYNVTDQDLLDSGIEATDEKGDPTTPGEFHISLNDGDTVSFDYAFPAA